MVSSMRRARVRKCANPMAISHKLGTPSVTTCLPGTEPTPAATHRRNECSYRASHSACGPARTSPSASCVRRYGEHAVARAKESE